MPEPRVVTYLTQESTWMRRVRFGSGYRELGGSLVVDLVH
jgi:hypothetical protein